MAANPCHESYRQTQSSSPTVRNRQLLIGRIDNDHCEQPCRLGVAGVLADPMMGAWILEPRLTGPVDASGLIIDLTPDRPREDVGRDESRAGVAVRDRAATRGVFGDAAA